MELTVFSDEHYMREALKEAQKAFDKDEVPIGAIVVCQNRIIESCNLKESGKVSSIIYLPSIFFSIAVVEYPLRYSIVTISPPLAVIISKPTISSGL